MTGPDSLDADTLQQMALGNPAAPNAYLCCISLNGSPRIHVVHTPSKYIPALDGRVTQWDNKLFCFLGELMQDTMMIVTLPATAFEACAETRVYDDATLMAEIINLNQGDLFPKLNANIPGAVVLRTRFLMYLPSRYIPLLLNNKGCTPKQAFKLLWQVFQDENVLAEVEPIVTWLRISLHATQANNHGPPTTSISITTLFLDEDLLNHHDLLLEAALPGRGGHSSGLEATIAQMATAVVQQTSEARTARVAHEVEKDQPTTPATKFGMLLDSLKVYLDVNEEANLPDFWFHLTTAPKKQEFSIIYEFLDAHACSPQAFIPLAPIPTPKLLTDLTSVTFLADHQDDLKTGLQPFIVRDGSEDHRTASLDLARSFDLLYKRYFSSRDSLSERFRQLLQHKIEVPHVIKPVHILRNIQLICFHWFAAK